MKQKLFILLTVFTLFLVNITANPIDVKNVIEPSKGQPIKKFKLTAKGLAPTFPKFFPKFPSRLL